MNCLRKEAVLVVVTKSGNLSLFKRCRCQVLVCRYVNKAIHNFVEHDQLNLLDIFLGIGTPNSRTVY